MWRADGEAGLGSARGRDRGGERASDLFMAGCRRGRGRTMGAKLMCVVVAACLSGAVVCHRDPCRPSSHKVIDDYRRSPSHRLQAGDTPLCDKSLSAGWYRFLLNGTNAQLPTACVRPKRCGTRMPLWLRTETNLPARGQRKTVEICGTISSTDKRCCMYSFSIDVKNCGQFYLYQLIGFPGCDLAYCSEELSTLSTNFCPEGTFYDQDSDICIETNEVPVAKKPNIVSTVKNREPFLACSFDVEGHVLKEDMFQIAWYNVSDSEGSIQTLHKEVTKLRVSYLSIATELLLGDMVFCGVTVFRSIMATQQLPEAYSDSFFTGIKIDQDIIYLKEDVVANVTFTSTVPAVCNNSDRSNCWLRLSLKAFALDGTPSDLKLSSCTINFYKRSCPEADCEQKLLYVQASADFLERNIREYLIVADVFGEGAYKWKNKFLPHVRVIVEDTPVGECYVVTDPHIITFDERKYEMNELGTFILVKSLKRNFEVHIRVWECQEGIGQCVCGFVAREENDVVSVNICDRTTPPGTARVTLPLGPLSNGTKIFETHEERIIELSFTSNTRLRANIEHWGMSLSLYMSGLDFGHTRGLCGIFDQTAINDVHDRRGSALFGKNAIQKFLKAWRLTKKKSYFHAALRRKESSLFTVSCNCTDTFKISQCTQPIRKTFHILQLRDITGDVNKGRNQIGPMNTFLSEQVGNLPLQGMATTHMRHVHADVRPPVLKRWDFLYSSRPSTVPSSNERGFLQLGSLLPLTADRGLVTGADICTFAVHKSATYNICLHLWSSRFLSYLIDFCTQDLQEKNDTFWISENMNILENMCEANYMKNSSWRRKESIINHDKIWPVDIFKALNCPEDCHGNGVCTAEGCECHKGFASFDCGQKADNAFTEELKPSVFEACDTRHSECASVTLDVPGGNTAADLQCKASTLKYVSDNWIPSSEAYATSTTLVNENKVKCSLPPSYLTHTGHLNSAAALNTFLVEVTDGIGRTVASKTLAVIDGLCQECMLEETTCQLKNDSCMINRRCYGALTVNPDNKCQQCLPDVDQFHWSNLRGNQAPVIQLPQEQLFIFQGSSAGYQIHTFDPEHSEVTFDVNRRDAYISRTGFFRWHARVNSVGPIERFRIQARDDCNKTSVAVLEIIVLSCKCENGGTCLQNSSGSSASGVLKYHCMCFPGFTGEKCQHKITACFSNPCVQGTCVDNGPSYRCICKTGFKGVQCEEINNLCVENPCFPSVRCISAGDSFRCDSCPRGMTGDGITCKGTVCTENCDDYNLHTTLQLQNQILKRRNPFYNNNLVCPGEINHCEGQPCYPGALCQDIPAPGEGFTCSSCPRFFEGDGINCSRTEQEACQRDVCHPAASCTEQDVYPGFQCGPCPHSFRGDGRNCTALCDPPCARNRICVDANKCACRAGYSGARCHLAVCHPPCKNRGICYRPNQCRCLPGYTGERCEQTICQPTCKNGGKCIGRNTCSCIFGFYGARCEFGTCERQCQNGGVCMGQNKCKCAVGYHGVLCETAVCRPVCENGGFCIRAGVCWCPLGYFGSRCQRAFCSPPCQHGGRCKRLNMCQCLPEYTGSRCRIALCQDACLNNGHCVAPNRCSCMSGWSGSRCEKAVCHRPCKNGGSCFKPGVCACSQGFQGSACGEPVCWPRCQNRGKCTSPNSCRCRKEYTGKWCEQKKIKIS